MIKLYIKHQLLEHAVNTMFNGMIKTFTPNIIKVTYDQLTDDMVGKMVVFVESESGYDYIYNQRQTKVSCSR
jgi:hypothetical protein